MSTRRLYWRTMAFLDAALTRLDDGLKPLYCRFQQRNNHGIFAVNIRAEVGFFAQLNWCVYIFAHCEQFALRPLVTLSSPFYTRDDQDNWLDYYFDGRPLSTEEKKLLAKGDVSVSHVSHIGNLGLSKGYGKHMTLENANRLLASNLSIKEGVQSYVDSFVSERFGSKRVIGVHYRGTDKAIEAPSVTFGYVSRTLGNYLDANPYVNAIFVASDEEEFVQKMRKEFNRVEVITHDDSLRSRDGSAIHARAARGDSYVKGWEALVNCLLLSRCEALIRTASFLSAWSSVFNPSLPVVMLNKPFDDKLWFPDAVIIKNALQQYLPVQGQT